MSSPGNPAVGAALDWFPRSFHRRRFGIAVWQWIGLLLALPVALAGLFFAYRTGRRRGEDVRESSLLWYWLSMAFPIVGLVVPLLFKHYAWDYLSLRGSALYRVNLVADIAFLLAVMALVIGGSSRIAESVIASPKISPKGLDANLIRIICRVLGIAAAIVVFLEGGRYLGFPITTLIASAGIGGLAIALSAQSLIKGLFGTVMILLDKPFRVGDRILVKGHDGFVEGIGLRSTSIRALSNHVISIPNDQIADAEVENITRRKHIRRTATLHRPLDTSREKLEQAVDCIRSILNDHEGMEAEFPPRVNFTEFTANAFEISFTYWFAPPSPWAFRDFGEKVNFEIFREFERRGIQFSLPVRHSYWKHDSKQGALEVALNSESPDEQSGHRAHR